MNRLQTSMARLLSAMCCLLVALFFVLWGVVGNGVGETSAHAPFALTGTPTVPATATATVPAPATATATTGGYPPPSTSTATATVAATNTALPSATLPPTSTSVPATATPPPAATTVVAASATPRSPATATPRPPATATPVPATATPRQATTTDIELTKVVDQAARTYGEQAVFTLVTRNLGKVAAADVVVSDEVPAVFEVIDVASTKGNIVVHGQTVSAYPGVLEVGEQASYRITVRVRPDAALGRVTNVGTVTTSAPGDDPANNRGTADVIISGPTATATSVPPTLTPVIPRATATPARATATPARATARPTAVPPPAVAVTLHKTANVDTAYPGDTILYTLSVSNAGPGTAHDVVIRDAMPSSLDPSDSVILLAAPGARATRRGQAIEVRIGDLAAGETKQVQLPARIRAGQTGKIINTADVFVREDDPSSATDTSSVVVTVGKRPAGSKDVPAAAPQGPVVAPPAPTIQPALPETSDPSDTISRDHLLWAMYALIAVLIMIVGAMTLWAVRTVQTRTQEQTPMSALKEAAVEVVQQQVLARMPRTGMGRPLGPRLPDPLPPEPLPPPTPRH